LRVGFGSVGRAAAKSSAEILNRNSNSADCPLALFGDRPYISVGLDPAGAISPNADAIEGAWLRESTQIASKVFEVSPASERPLDPLHRVCRPARGPPGPGPTPIGSSDSPARESLLQSLANRRKHLQTQCWATKSTRSAMGIACPRRPQSGKMGDGSSTDLPAQRH
jgi:hypothetical protein